jgi:hypothetical protein
MNTTSVIDNKIIDMLANEDILCTSKVGDAHILFKFDKLPENKKITLSRMFKSNWYSVDVIWNSGGFSGFKERSPKMLSTLRNLIPFSGNAIQSRTNIVNKYDTEFWFNFKPYFDLNDFGQYRDNVVVTLNKKSRDDINYKGLNFMHKLHFSPTIVEYGKEDASKLMKKRTMRLVLSPDSLTRLKAKSETLNQNSAKPNHIGDEIGDEQHRGVTESEGSLDRGEPEITGSAQDSN